MIKLLIASTNKFKVKILKDTWELAGLNDYATLYSPEELNLELDIEISEDTGTFEGDALKKAEAYSQRHNMPVISIDQGFGFSALEGWPGTSSKEVLAGSTNRVLGQKERVEGTLDEQERDKIAVDLILKSIAGKDREMSCTYAVAIAMPDGSSTTGQTVVHGTASEVAYWDRGYFYDTFFIPKGHEITLSQMPENEFNKFEREHMYKVPDEIIQFVGNIGP